MAKVSVIMPVYNGEKHLRESIESILEQETDLELIIVDDGSTDSSSEIIKSIHDRRVKVFTQKNSGNPAVPRNKGLKEATGSFIAFCDQDDLWYKDKLKKQLAALEEASNIRSVGLVATSADFIDESGKRIGRNRLKDEYISQPEAFEKLLYGNFVTACSALLPIMIFEKVDKLDETMIGVDDYDLWLRITKKYDVITLEETLCAWREGKSALSANKTKLYEEAEKVFEKAEEKNKEESVRIAHGKNIMRVIVSSILVKDYDKADEFLKKAQKYPLSNKAKKINSLYRMNRIFTRFALAILKTVGRVQL
jgi:glycosyltransferase involved in cell wall biosynthesis